jgi:hypothetical protein
MEVKSVYDFKVQDWYKIIHKNNTQTRAFPAMFFKRIGNEYIFEDQHGEYFYGRKITFGIQAEFPQNTFIWGAIHYSPENYPQYYL